MWNFFIVLVPFDCLATGPAQFRYARADLRVSTGLPKLCFDVVNPP